MLTKVNSPYIVTLNERIYIKPVLTNHLDKKQKRGKDSPSLEASALLLTATEHHDEPRAIADHDARTCPFAAQLVIELVVGVCRLLALQVQLQIAVRTARPTNISRYLTRSLYIRI